MKLNAYILAADPAWCEASILSYYDTVNRIVVSYDETGTSYNNTPLDIEPCLKRLRAIDTDGKMDFRPGRFFVPTLKPMENETRQRRAALEIAGSDADWVLQLDTDELLPDSSILIQAIKEAEIQGFAAVNFPSVWLYLRMKEGYYLGWCDRGFKRVVKYPGAMVIRPSVDLAFARRPTTACYHVDIRNDRSSDSSSHVVHMKIDRSSCIYHLSMLRSETAQRTKFASWSHSQDRDWSSELGKWLLARRHPRLVSALSQLEITAAKRHLCIIDVPPRVEDLARLSPNDLADTVSSRSGDSVLSLCAGLWAAFVSPVITFAFQKLLGLSRRCIKLITRSSKMPSVAVEEVSK